MQLAEWIAELAIEKYTPPAPPVPPSFLASLLASYRFVNHVTSECARLGIEPPEQGPCPVIRAVAAIVDDDLPAPRMPIPDPNWEAIRLAAHARVRRSKGR